MKKSRFAHMSLLLSLLIPWTSFAQTVPTESPEPQQVFDMSKYRKEWNERAIDHIVADLDLAMNEVPIQITCDDRISREHAPMLWAAGSAMIGGMCGVIATMLKNSTYGLIGTSVLTIFGGTILTQTKVSEGNAVGNSLMFDLPDGQILKTFAVTELNQSEFALLPSRLLDVRLDKAIGQALQMEPQKARKAIGAIELTLQTLADHTVQSNGKPSTDLRYDFQTRASVLKRLLEIPSVAGFETQAKAFQFVVSHGYTAYKTSVALNRLSLAFRLQRILDLKDEPVAMAELASVAKDSGFYNLKDLLKSQNPSKLQSEIETTMTGLLDFQSIPSVQPQNYGGMWF